MQRKHCVVIGVRWADKAFQRCQEKLCCVQSSADVGCVGGFRRYLNRSSIQDYQTPNALIELYGKT